MPVMKIDITQTQADTLLKVERLKQEAEQKLRDVMQYHTSVLSLVLDAHGIDPDLREIQLDIQNLQMLVNVPEKKKPLERITKPDEADDK